jgi:zinc protease
MLSRRLAAFLVVLLAAPAFADDAILKTAQSLYDGVSTETLPNGLRVYLKPVPGSQIVSTMVAYKVGSADEELDQTGLSHYLEHLMFKGTAKLKPGDIDRMTQKNGGQNNAYTTEDMTVYHFDFAADRWKIGLAIEADRMRNLRIDEEHEFEQEKGAVISELDNGEDQPWELEQKKILPLLFGAKAPYGHPVIGEKAHVRNATAAIIKAHYDRWYHPNNAAIVIAGDFDAAEAIAEIRKLFGPIPKTKLPERKTVPNAGPRKEIARVRMTSKFESPRLLFGFNTVTENDADAPVLDVLSQAFAGGRTSRLYRRLIEDDGTCTQALAAHMSGRYPGWFDLQLELAKDDFAAVEGVVFEELKKLAETGLTEAELKRAKRGIVAAHIFSHESIHELADTIARGVVAYDMDYVKGYLVKLDKITNADLMRVAKKYLIDAKPAIVESVPKKEPGKEPAKSQVSPSRPKSDSHAATGRRDVRLARDVAKPKFGGFSLGDAKTVDLENGMRVLLLENHRLPVVVVDAAVRRVRTYEPADQVGLAALMGDLMQEGTTTRDSRKIAESIEDSGGSLFVGMSGGFVKVLSPDTELGLDLLFDCLMNPLFDKAEIDAKREQILLNLAEEEKKPEERANRLLLAEIYGKHPLGRPLAVPAVLPTLKAKDLRKFHKQVFGPNNTVVAVVGDFDSAKMIAGLKKRTADWKRAKLPRVSIEAPKFRETATQKIVSDPDAAQLNVMFGHLGISRNNPDYYKLLVMDNVLGTGPGITDRLSVNLRDRKGLAYSVSARIAAFAGEDPGTFTGYIGTFPDKFNEVKEGFLSEIKRIREEVPSKDEVENAKLYLTGSLPFGMTTCEQAAGLLQSINRYNLGANYLRDYVKAIQGVTPEEVRDVAKKYLHPDRLTLIAVGPVDSAGKALKLPEKSTEKPPEKSVEKSGGKPND